MRRHVEHSLVPARSACRVIPAGAAQHTDLIVKVRPAQLVGLIVALLVLAGCSGGSETDDSGGQVLVSAAASLTDAFTRIEAAFEKQHVGVDVVLNVAGSASLRTQILEGAPADVFAPAGASDMDRIVEAGDVAGEPQIFARNRLEIAVPAGNPASVTGLADFADESLLIGLCAKGVPCGDFGRQALAKAGVVASIDTNEPNVRALLTKLAVGELDAGIVYVTDVMSTDDVEGIDIPAEYNIVADYPIAVLSGAPNPDGARAFVAFVVSGEGREILAEYGFSSP